MAQWLCPHLPIPRYHHHQFGPPPHPSFIPGLGTWNWKWLNHSKVRVKLAAPETCHWGGGGCGRWGSSGKLAAQRKLAARLVPPFNKTLWYGTGTGGYAHHIQQAGPAQVVFTEGSASKPRPAKVPYA